MNVCAKGAGVNSNFFDIAQAAQGYSQLGGIMAGFSFAVLVWLVDRLNLKDADTKVDILVIRALVFLGVTFLGNLLVSFFWALISGETHSDANRPQSLAYIASWQMALLAPLTMLSMALVVASTGSGYVVSIFRRIFWVTALVGLAFLWTESWGILRVYSGNGGAAISPTPIIATQIATFLILVVGFLLSRRPPNRRLRLDTEGSFSNFSSLCLVALTAGAIAFANMAISPPEVRVMESLLCVANIAWTVVIAWSCAFLPTAKSIAQEIGPPNANLTP